MIKRILSRITETFGMLGVTPTPAAIDVYNDILNYNAYTFEKVVSPLYNFSEEERNYIKNRLNK